jgi:hypothetical protein
MRVSKIVVAKFLLGATTTMIGPPVFRNDSLFTQDSVNQEQRGHGDQREYELELYYAALGNNTFLPL